MPLKNLVTDAVIQNFAKSLLLAVVFFFLAFQMEDMSSLFRYSAVAAGIAFAIEGTIKFVKDRKSDAS